MQHNQNDQARFNCIFVSTKEPSWASWLSERLQCKYRVRMPVSGLLSSLKAPRREFADAVGRMPVSDTGKHVAQPAFRIDEVEPGGLDKRIDRRGSLATLVRAGEKVVFAAERDGPETVLGPVAAREHYRDRKALNARVPRQCG